MIDARTLRTYGTELYFALKNERIQWDEQKVIDEYNSIWSKPNTNHEWTQYITNIICNSIKDMEYKSVLEVGCGIGTNLRALHEPSRKYYGLDISPVGIKHAKSFNDKIEYVCASAEHIPLESIDIVFSVHALERMNNCIDAVTKELYRITNKRLILIEPFYEHQNMFGKAHNRHCGYPKNLYKKIRNVGFSIVSFKRLSKQSNPVNKSSILICDKP
jgi:ubiquinone/menaquinone biosynthesis C-methylase UbiE